MVRRSTGVRATFSDTRLLYWHKTDSVAASRDVRSSGQSRSGVEAPPLPSLLRVSDAGRSQRCGLHRGRRPKAFNEGTRGKLQAVAPRAPGAMEVCAARSCVRATDADGCVG